MTKELTFGDVIEAHKNEVGAEKVHVTLGEGATPEGLAEELRKIREKGRLHASFTDLEIEQAKVARHKDTFSKITKLCQRNLTDVLSQREVDHRLGSIFDLSDMIADVSLEQDTIWMADQRLKKGQALPEGVSISDIDALKVEDQAQNA